MDAYVLLEIFKAMQAHIDNNVLTSRITNSNAGVKQQFRA
jgi:hypothetical protein